MYLLPIYILFGLHMLSLGTNLESHGRPRSNGNFWVSLVSFVINWGLLTWFIFANN